MELTMFLCIGCFLFSVNSQTVLQNPNILNPDHIYFADNRPSTGKPVNRQINTANGNLQQPYNNNVDVIQVPVTQLNLIETSTPIRTNFQRPLNGIGVLSDPIYDQADVNSRGSEEFLANSGQRNVRLDQNAAALTNFSINVMKSVILQKQGNTVISPYSIATLLALLQQGATELSLDQISVALQMTARTSAAVFKKQTREIQSRRSSNILRTANNVFVARAFSLNPEFKAVAQRDFDSDVSPTAFDQPELTASRINRWIAIKTNNKIEDLISPDSISVDTQMVLVNAIYFKGLWAIPFRPTSTRDDSFTLSNGLTKVVSYMMARRFLKAGIDTYTNTRVVILPFEGDEYSMMIILPSTLSNAQNTLGSLTVPQLESYMNFNSIEVVLKIPKFSVKADTDLTPVLKQMGVTQIFNQNSGLSGLGMYQTFTPLVSSAVHSAVLSIDEHGSTAAAASAFSVVALSNDEMPIVIRVDRPFVAVLWDEKTKVPLFMAKIEDPNVQ